MLFTKKEKKDAGVSPQMPRAPRYNCVVRIGINGFEGEAALKNISASGFRMESKTYAAIAVGEQYTMQIKPEFISGVKAFEMEVEVRWIQSDQAKFSAGFLIVMPPADRSFEKYLEHIKNQSQR
jgi:hypothetical protein